MPANEEFPLALPIGTVLAGQYSIEKVLGQGGFGITYRAMDHKTGGPVAVKEFFPETLAYREMTNVISYPGDRTESYIYGKESFLQEAQTLAQFIGNENIILIHSYFEENGTAYFVMDYIEGVSFDDYIKEKGGKIPFDDARRILVPVMDALAAVHSKGIVHRDVTPDNIYITKDNKIRLLDFGAARYSLGDKSHSLDVILKHGFAPKEQYTRHGKQGPYTDIYSLGATFYFALTGKRPPDSIDRIEEDEIIPPSRLGVQITDYQEGAILTAMAVQPSDRFRTMEVFKKVLLNENAQPAPAAQPVQPVPTVYTQEQLAQTTGVSSMGGTSYNTQTNNFGQPIGGQYAQNPGQAVPMPSQSVSSAVPTPSQPVSSAVPMPSQSVSSAVPMPSQSVSSAVPMPSQSVSSAVPMPSQSVGTTVSAPPQSVNYAEAIPSQPVNNAPPAKSGMSKKAKVGIFSAIGTVAVGAAIAIGVSVGSGNNIPVNDSNSKTTSSSPSAGNNNNNPTVSFPNSGNNNSVPSGGGNNNSTPSGGGSTTPTSYVTGTAADFKIESTSAQNLKNNGYYTDAGGKYFFIDDDYTNIKSSDGKTLYTSSNYIYSLSYDKQNNLLFFVDGNSSSGYKAKQIDLSTNKVQNVTGLSSYSAHTLIVTNAYYFVYDNKSKKITRIVRGTNKAEQTVSNVIDFALYNDKLYYIAVGSDGLDHLYCVSARDFSQEIGNGYYLNSGYTYTGCTVDESGKYLYTAYTNSDKTSNVIVRVSADFTTSSESKVCLILSVSEVSNLMAYNDTIIFTEWSESGALYKVTFSNADWTAQSVTPTKVYEDSVAGNIFVGSSVFSDYKAMLLYMGWNSDLNMDTLKYTQL